MAEGPPIPIEATVVRPRESAEQIPQSPGSTSAEPTFSPAETIAKINKLLSETSTRVDLLDPLSGAAREYSDPAEQYKKRAKRDTNDKMKSNGTKPSSNTVAIPSEDNGPAIGVTFEGKPRKVRYRRRGRGGNHHLVFVPGGAAEVVVMSASRRTTSHDHRVTVRGDVAKVSVYGNVNVDVSSLPDPVETHPAERVVVYYPKKAS